MLTGMYGLFCGVWAKQGGWRTLGVRNCSTSVCMKLLPCSRGTCHKGDIQKLKLLWDKVYLCNVDWLGRNWSCQSTLVLDNLAQKESPGEKNENPGSSDFLYI